MSLIWELLKILTIEEVRAFISQESGIKGRNITNILKQELLEREDEDVYLEVNNIENKNLNGKEEISSDNQREGLSGEIVLENMICGKMCIQLLSDWNIKFQKMESDVLGLSRFPILKELSGREVLSTFLFDEQRKIKKSYEKIKKSEIYNLYKETATVDIEFQRANGNNFDKADPRGIIIKKKQN